MKRRFAKECAVLLLVLVGPVVAKAEENAVMEAVQETQVCKLTTFMESVKTHKGDEQECAIASKGSRAMLAGVLQAGGSFFLLVDGDSKWWIGETRHWRRVQEEKGL